MFRGCDPEELWDAAASLDVDAGRIETLAAALQEGITAVEWEGPDADAYRSEARTTSGLLRLALVGSLRARATSLRAEADAQEHASSAQDAPPAAGPAPNLSPGTPATVIPGSADGSGAVVGEGDPRAMAAPFADRLGSWHSPRPPSPLPQGEAPSDGLIIDALGPEHGSVTEREWNTISQGSAVAGMAPVVGAAQAVGVGMTNVQLGRYEKIQGLREGDPFTVVDGYVTEKLAGLDAAANALELTPLAPVGSTASQVTGAVNGAWHRLRGAAMDREDSGASQDSSPSRLVFSLPRILAEDGVRPVGEWVGGPAGAALGVGADGVVAEHQRLERTIDDVGRVTSEKAQEKVPYLREGLAVPRRTAELPRRGPDSLRGP